MKKQSNNKDGETVLLNVGDIKNNPLNPRTSANPRYEDIRASIKILGVNTVPIEVYPAGQGGYMTLAGGGTRLKALAELSIEKALCIIRPDPGDDAVVLAGHLRENMARGDTTFPDSARGINAMLKPALAENSKTKLADLVAFLEGKGLAVSKTALSLYLKADFLFAGWYFYGHLSKRLVEQASASWEATRKVIGEYDRRLMLNAEEARRLFIAPAIDERNEKIQKAFSVITQPNNEAHDSERDPAANVVMEFRLLAENIAKRVAHHFAEQERQRSGGAGADGAEVVTDAIRISQRCRAMGVSVEDAENPYGTDEPAEPGGEEDGGDDAGRFTGAARRAAAEQHTATEESRERDEALENAQAQQEQQNVLMRLTAGKFRELLAEAINRAESEIRKTEKTVKVELPADLAANLYDLAVTPISYKAGDDRRKFLDEENGRVHRIFTGEDLNLEALFNAARTEAEAELREDESNCEGEPAEAAEAA